MGVETKLIFQQQDSKGIPEKGPQKFLILEFQNKFPMSCQDWKLKPKI